MYNLTGFGEILSALNAGLGVFMAHTLYKSPRKIWQCLGAWAAVLAICIPIGEVLNVLLPQYTEQRMASFTGCILILAYIYLFPQIPIQQRVFNYFLAVNCMNLLLISSRTVSMLLVGYFGLPATLTYAICYLLFATVYAFAFVKWLKSFFLRGLAVFQKNLSSLVIFAAICYFGTILLVDIWAPWPALNLRTAMPKFAVVAINLAGYVLAFRSLSTLGERLTAETEARVAKLQLGLAEKEYNATMEGIDHVRRMRHDMNHHLSAISALIASDQKDEVLSYIEKVEALVPHKAFFNGNFITNSFVDHYHELCEAEKIAFSAQISYNEAHLPNKAHLGILLGNSLQNALEAACEARGTERFLSIEGKQVHNNLILAVKNSFSGQLNSELKSTKGQGHGVGLGSMRSVVEEYGGYMDAGGEDGVFTLKIVLTLAEKDT